MVLFSVPVLTYGKTKKKGGRSKYRVIKKSLVHLMITVQKADDLKMAIIEHIQNVDHAILNTVFENTGRRVNKCLQTGGGPFGHYL